MTLELPGRFKGHVCGQENEVGDGLGMRLTGNHVLSYSTLETTMVLEFRSVCRSHSSCSTGGDVYKYTPKFSNTSNSQTTVVY